MKILKRSFSWHTQEYLTFRPFTYLNTDIIIHVLFVLKYFLGFQSQRKASKEHEVWVSLDKETVTHMHLGVTANFCPNDFFSSHIT